MENRLFFFFNLKHVCCQFVTGDFIPILTTKCDGEIRKLILKNKEHT
jgi:hypothetical protein